MAKSIFEHVRDVLNATVPGTKRKKPKVEAKAPPTTSTTGTTTGKTTADGQVKAPDLQAELHKRDAEIRAAVEKATAAKKAELERQQAELNEVRRKLEAELARQAERHAAVEDTTYTIVRGDTLSGIAKRFLGNAGRWPEIHAANKDTIANPNLIYPGQVIKIPPR